MAGSTTTSIFLQNTIFTNFILPFFLVWLIAFAVLQKSKILGEAQSQLNAIISLVVGFILVSAFNYSTVINNLVLFLSIGLVIIFVAMLLWGFVSGGEGGFFSKERPGVIRTILLIVLAIAVLIGVFWAFGIPLSGGSGSITDLLFNQAWSSPFWTNLIFIILIGIALALVIRTTSKGKG
jgi:hypothetical protein